MEDTRTDFRGRLIEGILERDFTYHKPNREKVIIHEKIREFARDYIRKTLIFSGFEERSSTEINMFLTKMEEAVFWVNAAIAKEDF